MVTTTRSQRPARAPSIALSPTSNTMWCRPLPSSVSPMYMPGRLRTASRPFKTLILLESYTLSWAMLDPELRPTIITVYDAKNQSLEGKKIRLINWLRRQSRTARASPRMGAHFRRIIAQRGAGSENRSPSITPDFRQHSQEMHRRFANSKCVTGRRTPDGRGIELPFSMADARLRGDEPHQPVVG